jgi:hypothetical protein
MNGPVAAMMNAQDAALMFRLTKARNCLANLASRATETAMLASYPAPPARGTVARLSETLGAQIS